MKPLYHLTDNMKGTSFNLFLNHVYKKISKEANKWFIETYIEPKDYINNEVLVLNLRDNLNYLFTEVIWLLEIGESLGYNMEFKRFIEEDYKLYTESPDGYKFLVHDERFDRTNNRVYTEEEIKTNKEQCNAILKEIISKKDLSWL